MSDRPRAPRARRRPSGRDRSAIARRGLRSAALACVASIAIAASTPQAAARPIAVSLEAAWAGTPFLHEAAEALASISPESFWSAASAASSRAWSPAPPSGSLQACWPELRAWAEAALPDAPQGFLEASVGARVQSARAAAFQSLYDAWAEDVSGAGAGEGAAGACEVALHGAWGAGVRAASFDELQKALGGAGNVSSPPLALPSAFSPYSLLHSFDHAWPAGAALAATAAARAPPPARLAVLYAPLAAPCGAAWARELRRAANADHALAVAWRPVVTRGAPSAAPTCGSAGAGEPVPLAGFSAVLAAKSTEYDASDLAKGRGAGGGAGGGARGGDGADGAPASASAPSSSALDALFARLTTDEHDPLACDWGAGERGAEAGEPGAAASPSNRSASCVAAAELESLQQFFFDRIGLGDVRRQAVEAEREAKRGPSGRAGRGADAPAEAPRAAEPSPAPERRSLFASIRDGISRSVGAAGGLHAASSAAPLSPSGFASSVLADGAGDAASGEPDRTPQAAIAALSREDRGLRAATILAASSAPLETFAALSRDPIALSPALAVARPARAVRRAAETLSRRAPPGAAALRADGAALDPRAPELHVLLAAAARRGALARAVRAAGVADAPADRLLSHALGAEALPAPLAALAAEPRVRLALGRGGPAGARAGSAPPSAAFAPRWVADPETDPFFQRAPAVLRAALQPAYPGRLPAVRRRLLTALVVFSPGTLAGLEVAGAAEDLASRRFPAAIGLVPYVPEALEDGYLAREGDEDADARGARGAARAPRGPLGRVSWGEAIARLFVALCDASEPAVGGAFLSSVGEHLQLETHATLAEAGRRGADGARSEAGPGGADGAFSEGALIVPAVRRAFAALWNEYAYEDGRDADEAWRQILELPEEDDDGDDADAGSSGAPAPSFVSSEVLAIKKELRAFARAVRDANLERYALEQGGAVLLNGLVLPAGIGALPPWVHAALEKRARAKRPEDDANATTNAGKSAAADGTNASLAAELSALFRSGIPAPPASGTRFEGSRASFSARLSSACLLEFREIRGHVYRARLLDRMRDLHAAVLDLHAAVTRASPLVLDAPPSPAGASDGAAEEEDQAEGGLVEDLLGKSVKWTRAQDAENPARADGADGGRETPGAPGPGPAARAYQVALAPEDLRDVRIPYISDEASPRGSAASPAGPRVTVWAVADPATAEGRDALRQTLRMARAPAPDAPSSLPPLEQLENARSTGIPQTPMTSLHANFDALPDLPALRCGALLNPADPASPAAHAVAALAAAAAAAPDDAAWARRLERLLDDLEDDSTAAAAIDRAIATAQGDAAAAAEALLASHARLARGRLGLPAGAAALVWNGRVLPLQTAGLLSPLDRTAIQRHAVARQLFGLVVRALRWDEDGEEGAAGDAGDARGAARAASALSASDRALVASSALAAAAAHPPAARRRDGPPPGFYESLREDQFRPLLIEENVRGAARRPEALRLQAVLDPTAPGAAAASELLLWARRALGASVQILLVPTPPELGIAPPPAAPRRYALPPRLETDAKAGERADASQGAKAGERAAVSPAAGGDASASSLPGAGEDASAPASAGVRSRALFARLPPSALLTLGVSVPDAWIVSPLREPTDFDNIRPSELWRIGEGDGASSPGAAPSLSSAFGRSRARALPVEAAYSLSGLVVAGSAMDLDAVAKGIEESVRPRGVALQLEQRRGGGPLPVAAARDLVAPPAPAVSLRDTLVMATLGYFQLPSLPGVSRLSLRPGASARLYELLGVSNEALAGPAGRVAAGEPGADWAWLPVASLDGVPARLFLRKDPAKPLLDVLDLDAQIKEQEDAREEKERETKEKVRKSAKSAARGNEMTQAAAAGAIETQAAAAAGATEPRAAAAAGAMETQAADANEATEPRAAAAAGATEPRAAATAGATEPRAAAAGAPEGGTAVTLSGSSLVSSDSSPDTIHVFTIASGHMYERLQRIMVLSVVKRSSRPVKIWIVGNYASPRQRELVALMGERYGFAHEFVTYRWPAWILPQTEKQRIIWAYKILFLDVLFPQSLRRVIFCDADQVVRADLAELWDADLGGAPYAYAPFCEGNADTVGYRFWRGGFWEEHLQGKPYHISALYLVDLDRFRDLAAGDTLRSIYQALAQDPNSLANLDQDLPNYAQHRVPIHSLDPAWLWCETWCGNASRPQAKTIDLCNNPHTKEPKLEGARRIIGEWSALNDEVERFADEVERAHRLRDPDDQRRAIDKLLHGNDFERVLLKPMVEGVVGRVGGKGGNDHGHVAGPPATSSHDEL